MEESEFASFLPHPGGHACTLGEGLNPELSCCLPTSPLIVPQLNTIASPSCTQPSKSCAHALLEGVSHWTERNQWLARGLKHHMDQAFRKFHTVYLEADELLQLRETTINRLVEAYASADG